jgi:L-arabinose 1-dehydrogenase
MQADYASAVRKSSNLEHLLAPGDLDAIFVALPNDLHGSAIRAAFQHGVHVCCEKPLTIEPDDARSLADAAVADGLVLFTASHRRENRHVRALAQRLPARARIVRARCRYFERIEDHIGDEQWYLDAERCGGGCLIDNGPNALDALRVILGELDVVGCTLGPAAAGELRARVELQTYDAIPVTMELDWAYPGEVKDVTVWLDDGTEMHADMLAGTSTSKGSLLHEYAAVVDRFAGLIDAGTPVLDLDGVRVVELIAAAYELGRAS